MKDITEIINQKQLACLDFGSVELVKPTGQYIYSDEYQDGYIIEVQRGFFGNSIFGSKHWVAANRVRVIHKASDK